jgi:hypothetical protein
MSLLSNVNKQDSGIPSVKSAIVVASVWFLITFPGRAGFDTVYAIQLMRDGETTNWWTAWYFRILQVLTFNGKNIFVFALFGILLLTLSFLFFVRGLPFSTKVLNFAFYGTVISPIFGVFGVTVQHDVLQTSGLLLLLGLEIRNVRGMIMSTNKKLFLYSTSFALMATSHAALVTVSLSILILIIRYRQYFLATALTVGFVSLTTLSGIGVDSSWMKNGKFDSIILDLKCIAQHPDARINETQWKFLETMMSVSEWKNPVSCSSLSFMPFAENLNYQNIGINTVFIKTYVLVSLHNPSLWAQSHIVRTTLALPPPFFRSPENMVDLDYSKPVGEGTNWALQKGNNIVIHPSVDDPSLEIEVPILHQLDFLVQAVSFVINQASWFWGWAGFWLWPTLLLLLLIASLGNKWFLIFLTTAYPVLSLHLLYVVFGWGPTPRHLQVTIIVGIFASLIFIRQFVIVSKDAFSKSAIDS